MSVLRDHCAVITGGSAGIGLAIARAFAREGASLLLVARNETRLRQAAVELSDVSGSVDWIAHDLTARNGLRSLADSIRERFPRVHVLVNNAGVAHFTPFAEVGHEELDEQIALNVCAPFQLTQALLPALRAVRGSVINISSFHARRALPHVHSAAYSATKGAVESMTRALAYELGPLGIRVNAIAPGNVLTEKVRAYVETAKECDRARIMQLVESIYPLQRFGDPSAVGGAAVYLASPAADWVTGSVLAVDGGVTTN